MWTTLLLCTTSLLLSTSSEAKHLFSAYDCIQPHNIQDTSFNIMDKCSRPLQVKGQRNVTYQVLQVEKYRQFKGYACTIVTDMDVSYCGVYDHQTAYPEFSYAAKPHTLSPAECQRMITTKSLTINCMKYDITVNGVTLVKFETKGRTYIKDGEVKCEGDLFYYRKKRIDRAIVTEQWRITIEHEEYIAADNGDVTAHLSQVKLPCATIEGGCQTALVTYVWTRPTEYCPAAVTRTITGLEVTNGAGDAVVMSTDGSLIRLIKETPVSMCGRIVYSTNYDRIYLYATTGVKPFTKHVHPSEVSIITYVNNRDDFLYHYVMTTIQDEFQRVIIENCKQKHTQSQLTQWLQHSDPGLATFFLGNGTFATASGETLYTYQCRPRVVAAMDLPHCFQSLPVELVNHSTDPGRGLISDRGLKWVYLVIELLENWRIFNSPGRSFRLGFTP